MLKHRLFSAVILIGLLVLVVFWQSLVSDVIFAVLGSLCVAAAISEFLGMTKHLDAPGFPQLAMAASVLLLMVFFAQGRAPGLLPANAELWLTWALVLVALWQVYQGDDLKRDVRSFVATCAAWVYLALPLTYLARVYFLADPKGPLGGYLLMWVVLVTKFGDVGGYTVGSLTAKRAGGNHKITPRLSPKKSWEGLVGSIIFSMAVSALLNTWLTHDGAPLLAWPMALGLGVVFAVLGLLGDLSASALKRASEVKDSGSSIPGLGGVLDLLDSLILTAPLFYFVLGAALGSGA